MEARLEFLESLAHENRRAIADLRVSTAETAATVRHFAETSEELKETVKELHHTVATLTEALNKGKGAIWMAGGLAAFGGGAIATFINKVLG